MTIDPAAIEAAKRIADSMTAKDADFVYDARAVARALLDAKLYLDLANKTILAHLDAAGGQDAARRFGIQLGEDIVVGVLKAQMAELANLKAHPHPCLDCDSAARTRDDLGALRQAAQVVGEMARNVDCICNDGLCQSCSALLESLQRMEAARLSV